MPGVPVALRRRRPDRRPREHRRPLQRTGARGRARRRREPPRDHRAGLRADLPASPSKRPSGRAANASPASTRPTSSSSATACFCARSSASPRRFPTIAFDDCIVDAACMKLVMNPHSFDVMVMENLFGDILSDLDQRPGRRPRPHAQRQRRPRRRRVRSGPRLRARHRRQRPRQSDGADSERRVDAPLFKEAAAADRIEAAIRRSTSRRSPHRRPRRKSDHPRIYVGRHFATLVLFFTDLRGLSRTLNLRLLSLKSKPRCKATGWRGSSEIVRPWGG